MVTKIKKNAYEKDGDNEEGEEEEMIPTMQSNEPRNRNDSRLMMIVPKA